MTMTSKFDLKADMTWRDVLTRVALVLATVAIIVWFMPRDNRINFKMELGRPWHYGDLTAPFSFPVFKSEEAIKAERDSVLRDYEPYYTLADEVGSEQVRLFLQKYSKGLPELSYDYKVIIANRLQRLYDRGIIDTRTPLEQTVDSTPSLRVVSGKTAVSIPASRVLTAVRAYEQLMGDSAFMRHREAIQQLNLNDYIVPNLTYDSVRSEIFRQELLSTVALASGTVQQGQRIISRGTIVDEPTYLVLESFVKESNRRLDSQSKLSTVLLGQTLYVLLLVGALTLFLSLYRKDYFSDMRSLGMVYVLFTGFSVMAALLVSHNLLHVYIIPFAMVPIFISVFMDSRTAFMTHALMVLTCACMLHRPMEFTAVEITAGLAAIFSLRDLSSRSQLFWTAAIVTGASCAMSMALSWLQSTDLTHIDLSEPNYLMVCGVIIFCCYPMLYIIEKAFGFTSNITLIELSDMNKELLRRMSEVAPGTFQHSIQVGNLAAEIARKIGANAQLVRTGALYHDIGKTQNPIYFTENQSGGINPHDQLTPIESADMIISHVTDGLKLADKYNLPTVLRNFIATHHGQGKAKYFYVKWKNEHPGEDIDDLLFTYPGPNPFTKEQAILMMADAVEAASRSLPDYTEQSIRTLVGRILDQQVQEGYFRECPITFRDIAYAKTVLIEKLKTIYHTRVSYPELRQPSVAPQQAHPAQ